MTERLFSFGSSKGTYDPLLQEDAIESFQMHDFNSKSYLEEMYPEQDFQLIATSYVPPNPSEDSSKEANLPYDLRPGKLTPYQLKLDESALFPEFYFHFKRSFSAISLENRAYCTADLEKFRSFYVGNEQDIKTSVIRVEQDFDTKFKECLDPKLLNEFSTSIFTRTFVETSFRDKLMVNVDHSSHPKRMDSLIRQARSGTCDVMPLLDFLMAYNYPESAIWFQVLLVYGRYFNTEKRKKFLNMKADSWQKENAPLVRKIQGFVNDLKEKGLVEHKGAIVAVVISLLLFVGFIVFALIMATSESPKKHGH